MGTRNRIKGPALVSAAALAALVLLGAAAALVAPGAAGASASRAGGSLCPPGKQFWDAVEEHCQDCSVCREPRRFVLRACHVLADTKCGYARELVIGRVRPRHHSTAPVTTPATTHPAPVSTGLVSVVSAERGVHRPRGRWGTEMDDGAEGRGESGERAGHWPAALVRRMHKHRDRSNNSSSSTGYNHNLKKYRDYLFHHHHHHRQKARPPESAAQLLGAEGARGTAETSVMPGGSGGGGGSGSITSTSAAAATATVAAVATRTVAAGVVAVGTSGASITGQPLSTAEELAWDWQAAVLVAAVAACALFFGAAALHGFRQLRQDARRSADADNLSATLSLMVPELINDIPYSCSVDGHNTNQCLYIEQLLVRKNEESKEGQGNVYIDRGKGKMHE